MMTKPIQVDLGLISSIFFLNQSSIVSKESNLNSYFVFLLGSERFYLSLNDIEFFFVFSYLM